MVQSDLFVSNLIAAAARAHSFSLEEGHEEGHPAPVVVISLSIHPGEVAFLHVRQEDVGEELGKPDGARAIVNLCGEPSTRRF